MNHHAFLLVPDPTDLGDAPTDVEVLSTPGFESASLLDARTLSNPGPLRATANFARILALDFPCVDPPRFAVVSPRMLNALRSISDFAHQTLPMVMLDDVRVAVVASRLASAAGRDTPRREDFENAERAFFDEDGGPLATITDSNFVVLHLTEHSDAFDWDRSEYDPSGFAVGPAGRVTKLVLKDVPLPPIFRLAAAPYNLYVSAEARAALERAGIRGPLYLPA